MRDVGALHVRHRFERIPELSCGIAVLPPPPQVRSIPLIFRSSVNPTHRSSVRNLSCLSCLSCFCRSSPSSSSSSFSSSQHSSRSLRSSRAAWWPSRRPSRPFFSFSSAALRWPSSRSPPSLALSRSHFDSRPSRSPSPRFPLRCRPGQHPSPRTQGGRETRPDSAKTG